jgi:hypothetical protein
MEGFSSYSRPSSFPVLLTLPDAAFGGKQTIYAAGLNWYATKNIRFMLDYLRGIIDKPAVQPISLPQGGSPRRRQAASSIT